MILGRADQRRPEVPRVGTWLRVGLRRFGGFSKADAATRLNAFS